MNLTYKQSNTQDIFSVLAIILVLSFFSCTKEEIPISNSREKVDIYGSSNIWKIVSYRSVDTVKIVKYNGTDTDLVIPTYVDGKFVAFFGTDSTFNSGIKITSVDFYNTGINTIGGSTFKNQTQLKSVTFSNTLKRIGYYAFDNCGLVELDLFNTDIRYMVGSFINNSNLRKVNLPKSLDSLADTFRNCDLREVDFSKTNVTKIECCSFSENNKLSNVIFPSSLQVIGDHAFYNCSLEELYLLNTELIKIGGQAFTDNTSLKKIVLPPTLTGNIETYTFKNCNINEIDLSKTKIIIIKLSAFENNSTLNKVLFPPSLEIIDIKAFYGCSIIELDLSNTNVRYIGGGYRAGAFQYNTNLEKVFLPKPLESLGMDAFYNCSNLNEITINGNKCAFNDKSFSFEGTPIGDPTKSATIYYPSSLNIYYCYYSERIYAEWISY